MNSIPHKNFIYILLVTALILLLPLLAMRFTNVPSWDLLDFAVAGTLLLGTGLIYQLISGRMRNTRHRIILAAVLIAAFLLVWLELAVGVFGTPFSGS